MIRLNLGCGDNKLEGWINVDLHGSPDIRCDLEMTPWMESVGMSSAPSVLMLPIWETSSVDEIAANHFLEHVGQTASVFIGIMKEMHRVCKPDARIHIAVPHPRHENFINDPTHVRIITPELLALFSKRQCAEVKRLGGANTPLAVYHDVDFEIESCQSVPDPRWEYLANRPDELNRLSKMHLGVISEYRIVLKVIK